MADFVCPLASLAYKHIRCQALSITSIFLSSYMHKLQCKMVINTSIPEASGISRVHITPSLSYLG